MRVRTRVIPEASSLRADRHGRHALVTDAQASCTFAGFLVRFRPRADTNSRWLYYVTQSLAFQQAVAAEAVSSTISNFNAERYANLRVPFVDITEQRRIVDFLDDQVARIEASLAQAAMLRVSCEQRELTQLAELFAGVDASEIRLAHLAHVQSGVTVDSSRRDPRVRDFSYLSVANVQDGHLALKAVKTIALDEREARRFMLRPGDVLMTEGGDLDKLGRGTVWRGEIADCLHQNHVFAVRPHPRRVSADYLALATRTPAARRHFQLTARKTTNLASTNSANIRDWPVPMPSLDEQARVVDQARRKSDASAAALGAAESLARLLEERKRALITACVTGEFDVSSASDRAGAAALAGSGG